MGRRGAGWERKAKRGIFVLQQLQLWGKDPLCKTIWSRAQGSQPSDGGRTLGDAVLWA